MTAHIKLVRSISENTQHNEFHRHYQCFCMLIIRNGTNSILVKQTDDCATLCEHRYDGDLSIHLAYHSESSLVDEIHDTNDDKMTAAMSGQLHTHSRSLLLLSLLGPHTLHIKVAQCNISLNVYSETSNFTTNLQYECTKNISNIIAVTMETSIRILKTAKPNP